jgi:hypothetical protein
MKSRCLSAHVVNIYICNAQQLGALLPTGPTATSLIIFPYSPLKWIVFLQCRVQSAHGACLAEFLFPLSGWGGGGGLCCSLRVLNSKRDPRCFPPPIPFAHHNFPNYISVLTSQMNCVSAVQSAHGACLAEFLLPLSERGGWGGGGLCCGHRVFKQ